MSANMHYSFNTLESCKHVTIQYYDILVKERFDCNNMSVLFLNINGVKSNFDSFLAQVQLIELKFNFNFVFVKRTFRLMNLTTIHFRVIGVRNYILLIKSTWVLELLCILTLSPPANQKVKISRAASRKFQCETIISTSRPL